MKSAKLLKLLYVQVLIGLVLGIAVGHWWPEFGAALKPLGDGFVKLVKMMIAPIVFCTIVSGITSLNDSKQIGKTLLKSMGLFYALTILALLTGLASVFLLQPGAGMHIDPSTSTRPWPGSTPAKSRRAASPSSCCTSFPIRSSAHSPTAKCCRCCCCRSFAASG
jgi:Na+/H+-dicarboxylate symporter